jgi:hypothetical protein
MPSRWATLLLCLAAFAVRADAESWNSVFAAERDTAVFLGTDGTLFRAPFNLNTRESLWRGPADQHVVRFAVSLEGNRIAWITRGFDEDTTRLWVCTANGTEQRLRYFALLPRLHGHLHSEPDVPTIADPDVRGGRLVQAGALMLRFATNTLEWASDGQNVLLGYDGGIVSIAADTHTGSGVTDIVAVELDALHPSPMFLVDALTVESSEGRPPVSQFDITHMFEGKLVVHEGRKVSPSPYGRAVLTPTSTGWQMFKVPEWTSARARAVGSKTLWWAKNRLVYSMQADGSKPTVELRASDDVLWLGYDEAHGNLLGVAGRQLWRRREAGGAPDPVLETASDIRAVLPSRTSSSIAVTVKDSVLVWDPETNEVRRFRADDLAPCVLFESPEHRIVVQVDCGAGLPRRLARADTNSGCLVPIDTPAERKGVFQPAGRGAWILLYDPGPRPPRKLRAYDVKLDRWRSVENPGITAWEPLR